MGMCETTEASTMKSFMRRRDFKEEQSLSKSGSKVLEGHRKRSVDSSGFWISLEVERKGWGSRERQDGMEEAKGCEHRGEAVCFICVPVKNNLQEGWGWSWSRVGAGGGQVTEQ